MRFLVLSIFLHIYHVTSDRDALILEYDPLNGQRVNIRSTNWTDVERIEFRLITTDNKTSGIWTWADLYLKPQSTPSAIPRYSYQWDKPTGVCGEYEIRTTFSSTNGTLQQTLHEPPLEFLPNPNIRLMPMIYDQRTDTVSANLLYFTDLKYWSAGGVTFNYVELVLKFLGCQKLFDRSPRPPLIPDRLGQLIVFDVQYAYSNCSFRYGLNVSFKAQNDENCQRNFTSKDNESLILNLSCATVRNLQCPTRTESTNGTCSLDCSPLDVRTVQLDGASQRSFRNQDNDDYVSITWSYPRDKEKSIISYQARYQQANLSDWNTVLSERETTIVDFDTLRNSLEIYPTSNVQSTNFTFQLCALFTPNCTSPIDWNKVGKYKFEYFHEKSSPKEQPRSAITRDNNSSLKCLSDKLVLIFVSLILSTTHIFIL